MVPPLNGAVQDIGQLPSSAGVIVHFTNPSPSLGMPAGSKKWTLSGSECPSCSPRTPGESVSDVMYPWLVRLKTVAAIPPSSVLASANRTSESSPGSERTAYAAAGVA